MTTFEAAGPIFVRIESAYETFSPRARRVADVVLDHLGDVASYSVAEIAGLSSTSNATVSRFFQALGFDDFAEVKAHLRGLRTQGVPLGGRELGDRGAQLLRAEVENLSAVFSAVESGAVDALAARVIRARRVIIMGFRNSYSVAVHLREALTQIRPDVSLVPHAGQSQGEELAQLAADDLVIVFGFRRRLSQFDDLIRYLHTAGCGVVLISDVTARRHARFADTWIVIPIEADGAFDSYAAPMSFIAQLAGAVLAHGGESAQRRVADIAGTYEILAELDGEDLGYRRQRIYEDED